MTTKLATQDGKIRIHYEDESVKVFHQVEYYQMKFYDREKKDLDSIKILHQQTPISCKMQKKSRITNNFKWETHQEQVNIEKKDWYVDTKYSYTSNKIVAIYFGGKEIYMRNRPKQEVKK